MLIRIEPQRILELWLEEQSEVIVGLIKIVRRCVNQQEEVISEIRPQVVSRHFWVVPLLIPEVHFGVRLREAAAEARVPVGQVLRPVVRPADNS